MNLIQTKSIAEQVEDLLRGRIRDGVYLPGSRIPSESELSEEFGVSRATVRTVLAKLAVNGLIIRRQGDGTYVNDRVREIFTHGGNLWEFGRIIEANGFKPTIKLIEIKKLPATKKEADILAVKPGGELLSLTRLFHADGFPVILARNVIPVSLLHDTDEKIDGQLHLSEIVGRYCLQKIAFAITEINSALLPADAGSYLQKDAGQTILYLQIVFFNKQNIPISLGSNYFDDRTLRLNLVQAWFQGDE